MNLYEEEVNEIFYTISNKLAEDMLRGKGNGNGNNKNMKGNNIINNNIKSNNIKI